jgi:hypothetical protein
VTLWPVVMRPQSGPLSNVTVCGALSALVHVTVPPAETADVVGLKAMFATPTC